MDSLLIVLDNSIPIFFTVLAAVYLKTRKLVTASGIDTLAAIIFKFILPVFVFGILHNLAVAKEDLPVIALVFMLNIVMIAIVTIVFRLLSFGSSKVGSLQLTYIGYSVGSFAYPFVSLNFDFDVFQKVVLIDIMLFVTTIIFSPLIAMYFDQGKREMDFKSFFDNISKDFILWAVFLALVVNFFDIQMPDAVTNTVDFVGGAFLVLIILFTAFMLKKPKLKSFVESFAHLAFRSALLLIGIILISIVTNPESSTQIALILTLITPFSSYGLLYSQKHKLDSELIAESTIYTIIQMMILYPILIVVVQKLF